MMIIGMIAYVTVQVLIGTATCVLTASIECLLGMR